MASGECGAGSCPSFRSESECRETYEAAPWQLIQFTVDATCDDLDCKSEQGGCTLLQVGDNTPQCNNLPCHAWTLSEVHDRLVQIHEWGKMKGSLIEKILALLSKRNALLVQHGQLRSLVKKAQFTLAIVEHDPNLLEEEAGALIEEAKMTTANAMAELNAVVQSLKELHKLLK